MSTSEQTDQGMAITVWKDGTWMVWGVLDAYYAQNDPEWLVTIPLKDLPRRREVYDDKSGTGGPIRVSVAEE